jgi:hypothetical protein
MGTISVRVAPPDTERGGSVPAGEERERFRLLGSEGVVALPTEKLAASLQAIAGELSRLFQHLNRVAGFELEQVEVGLEISAEGGFNLIGNAKAGGKGAITLTFSPNREP